MKTLLIIISIIGLALVLLPSVAVFTKLISLETSKTLMFLGTIIWFSSSTFWINKMKS